MACDICGKKGTYLNSLRESYKTEDIHDICSECEKEVNDHLRKLQRMSSKITQRWFKRFMINLKGKKQ